MKKKLKNYGFKYQEPAIQDYRLGGLSKVSRQALQIDGQWTHLLPLGEKQTKNGVETYSCISFACANQVEILFNRKFGLNPNYSDRALAIASNTEIGGNTPNEVYETARKILGFIPEELLPFSDDIQSFEDYHSPKPLNKKYYDEGRKWLNQYDLKHEWINTNPQSLMEALQYSPIAISVDAWRENNGYYFKPKGSQDNHFTLLVGYKENDHWLIYDSYPETEGDFIKKLVWNYWDGSKSLAKGISIKLVNQKQSCFKKLWSFLFG